MHIVISVHEQHPYKQTVKLENYVNGKMYKIHPTATNPLINYRTKKTLHKRCYLWSGSTCKIVTYEKPVMGTLQYNKVRRQLKTIPKTETKIQRHRLQISWITIVTIYETFLICFLAVYLLEFKTQTSVNSTVCGGPSFALK